MGKAKSQSNRLQARIFLHHLQQLLLPARSGADIAQVRASPVAAAEFVAQLFPAVGGIRHSRACSTRSLARAIRSRYRELAQTPPATARATASTSSTME